MVLNIIVISAMAIGAAKTCNAGETPTTGPMTATSTSELSARCRTEFKTFEAANLDAINEGAFSRPEGPQKSPKFADARAALADCARTVRLNRVGDGDPAFAARVLGEDGWFRLRADGDLVSSLQELDEATRLNGSSSVLHYELAVVHARKYFFGGRLDATERSLALQELAAALAADPTMPEPYGERAQIESETASTATTANDFASFLKYSNHIRPELFFWRTAAIDAAKKSAEEYVKYYPSAPSSTQR
jgi:hypothetical protein